MQYTESFKGDISTASSWSQQTAPPWILSQRLPYPYLQTQPNSSTHQLIDPSEDISPQAKGYRQSVILATISSMQPISKLSPLPQPSPPSAFPVKSVSTSQVDESTNRKKLGRYPSVKIRVLQWQKLHKDNIQSTVWSEQSVMTDRYIKPSILENNLDLANLFRKMEEMFRQRREAGNLSTSKKKKK